MGLADEPEHAEDAALAVELDIAPLPVVADRNASVAGSTLLFAGTASNCATTFTAAIGDVQAAFRDAPYRRQGSFRVPRPTAFSMATPGVNAGLGSGRLTT